MRLINLFFASLLVISSSAAIYAKEVKLLTSIKPIQLIAAAIQDGVNTPDVLLPIGASAHHYSLRPNDIQRIRDADLFYWIGQDMEIFLTKTIQARKGETITIQKLPDIKLRYFSQNQKEHDGHDHEHQAGHIDPHLWLSPVNANIIATRMADDLSSLDPLNKEKYQHNLQLFQRELGTTDQTIEASLKQITLAPFFVSHETYNYFEEAYGIKHDGVFSLNSTVQPGIKQVAEMKQRLKEAGVSCIFYEPPVKPKLADTLSQGLPVNTYELDAMGTDIPLDSQGYLKLLDALAKQVQQCKK